MARLVKEIGTGETGIVIDKGPRMQVTAAIRAMIVRVCVFVCFIFASVLYDFCYECMIEKNKCQPYNKKKVNNCKKSERE